MRCEDWRDAISARMDGEEPGIDADAVDSHLAACPRCRAFADRAAHVTRLTRLRPAEAPDRRPDLVPGLLTALDTGAAPAAPRRPRRALARDAVRVALAVLGVGQLALALSGVVAAAGAAHGPGRLAGASITHFSHESAAWNLALGVAFLWAASGAGKRDGRRAGGLVPVIGAFVALLVSLSALDLLAGHVEPARLLGHLPVVAGLLLLLLHARPGRDGGGRSTAPEDEHADSRRHHDGTDRRDGGHEDGYGGGLQPTAEHPAA